MSIENIQSIAGGIGGIDGLEGPRTRDVGAAQGKNGPSFAESLGQALGAVEAQQVEADQQAAKVAMGGGNLHEMSLALEKADITMRLAMKVRTKLVEAYNDIMRMGV
ncbi:MAG TPA: flagellar hook-basal body complex protein FliE [Polyangia bacterium]|nr:flagellar hook-basal body complex protein FliE [Polyangia bacterium]